jgi:polyferredoxin
VFVTALVAAGFFFADATQAAGFTDQYPPARQFFPDADRFGEPEGSPPAVAAYRGQALLGYLILSFDVVRIPAYSGRPINTLVGVDLDGRIVGAAIVHHEEPILGAGVSEQQLRQFVEQYRGISAHDRITVGAARDGYVRVDTISGATITVMVENATIQQTARALAESRGLRPAAAPPSSAPAAAKSGSPPAAPPVTVSTPPAPKPVFAVGAGESADAPSLARGPRLGPIAEEPIWVNVWRERTWRIAVLVAGLIFLTLILVFQDWLARHPTLLRRLRTGFLLFTLFFIGWYALGQLSVLNVLTFVHAAMHNFQWESFLIEPFMFILWSFVAMTLLLWGRGVYCGWLCPFGALQELGFQLAQKLKLPTFEIPPMVHERLWALKYIILLALFGVSLQSLTAAERLAEVEPFKTAITLRFQREWGYVLFAAGLVALSVLNRKFYCKYLCPLGAALTIPAKFRIFDWLRRHRECGRPCQICAVECEVQAIKKNGEINPNECHYCLDCQVTYWSEHKCPPLVEKRKRREKAVRAKELVRGMEAHIGPSGLEQIPVRVEPKPPENGSPPPSA